MSAKVAQVRGYLRATTRTVLAAYWRETTGRATTSLDALPDNYRQVLGLRFLQGWSIKDTATQMGIGVGYAKVLQHRALRRAARLNDV